MSTGFMKLPHPPYSPDLAPSDYWLFTHLKHHLKGRRFETKEDLRDATSEYLTSLDPSFFLIRNDKTYPSLAQMER